MLPEFPRARDAIQKVWNRILFNAAGFSDPLISEVRVRAQREGHRAFCGESETEYEKQSVSHCWQPERGKGIPTEEFFGLAKRLGEEMAAGQAKRFFEALSDASPRSGTLEKSDGPLTFDLWLKKMEDYELDFDEIGTPKWPTWYVSSEAIAEFRNRMATVELTAEERERQSALVEKKRKEFDERESRRRLVD